jgi:hypothetical protein
MKKLSEQFREMSQRAATWENRTAAMRQENRQEFEADVAEAQASVRAAQAAFAARLDKVEAPVSAQWRGLKDSFDKHVADVRRKVADLKAADELTEAQVRADDAEAYAEIAAEFASLTATEAETAMVEAKQARADAQSLEKARS